MNESVTLCQGSMNVFKMTIQDSDKISEGFHDLKSYALNYAVKVYSCHLVE